jgi:cytochrome P450
VVAGSRVAAAVVQEVLRLNVAVGANFRTTLQDTTVHGYSVPAGTNLYLSVGKSIEGTGPGRDVFDPNYWLHGAGEAVTNTERGNFTFGHGPRRCIGQSLATVELVVLLAVVAREVSRIDMTPEEAARPFGNPVFGHPSGLPLTLVPRA